MNAGKQLEIFGLDGAMRLAVAGGATRAEKSQLVRRVEVTHELLSALPTVDDLAFPHSGLCQTCLPHSRPASNQAIWTRSSGRFSLMVTPGVIDDRPPTARPPGPE